MLTPGRFSSEGWLGMKGSRAAIIAGVVVSSLLAVGCGKSGGGGGGGVASSASTASTASSTAAVGSSVASGRVEYLTFAFPQPMAAQGIVSLLNQTLGAASLTSGTAATALPLRNGFTVTATPQGSNVVLEFDSDGGGVRPNTAYAQVAVPIDVAAEFIDISQTAMAVAALTSATPGLPAPWQLYLQAQSPTGGSMQVQVSGDANCIFSIEWDLQSPVRPINAFAAPTAFGPPGSTGATCQIGGTVHFPIDLPTFQFYVNQAYGYNAPQRFNDFALIPHTWLHLTVTADPTGTVVNVRFDAVVTSGARIFVAQAPASTDVGGRFFDETCARMNEMNAEEAAQPGSSKPWGTSFYYADPTTGVVDVVVKGTQGSFDIAYAVASQVFPVSP